MIVDKIYDLLADKAFQEPRTGDLFFPAYIYTYPPEDEYKTREEIALLTEKLKRPNNFLDCLVLNIYDEFIEHLKSYSFAGRTIFDEVVNKEKSDPKAAAKWIRQLATDRKFYNYISDKVHGHFEAKTDKRVYLLIHGFGSSFPYVRASEFLKNTESLIKEFKIIVFYPGEYKDGHYSLFKELHDDNMYRANHLNQLLNID
jgi:hypothetical protein